MPTVRYRHIRHLLKDGKAKICSRHPFTIQLTYDSEEEIQPMEIGMDAGYQHVGVSVKSAKREYFSAQFDLLKDEKQHHDDCRKYRRSRHYQQGPLYFADSLRAAVFQRDQYTCQICGKSAIKSKEPVHLHTHHALYWKGHHANTLNELITVCSDCHTPENHQKGGKLWGLTPDVPRLEGATFMNVVRWKIINVLRENLPDVEICHTYGAVTSRKRKEHGIKKSHALDAYCIGDFLPLSLAKTEHYQKCRRNNRILEKFYDAKVIDVRDGTAKAGKDLGCNRANRREPRNSENNLQIFRGEYLRHGRRSIRRQRYPIQAGDIVMAKGKIYCCHGTMSGGKSILLLSAKESPTGKAVTATPKKVTVIRHASGWIKI